MVSESSIATIDRRHHSLVRWGLVGTACYLGLVVVYVLYRLPDIFALRPNEFGDLLAGIFAPLALAWLVLGFFQQGHELQASTAALQLQADELRNSVTQQQELVTITRLQLDEERSRAANEEATARRIAQPRFVVVRDSHEVTRQHPLVMEATFTILNAGTRCLDVTMVKGEGVNPVKLNSWENAEERRFIWHTDDVLEDRTIEISYIDVRGDPGMATLLLQKTGDYLRLSSGNVVA